MATDKDLVKQDDIDKLKLEKSVLGEIKSLFAIIRRDNAKNIAATGQPISGSKHRADWEVLFRKHYTKVQNKFTGKIAATLEDDEREFTENETREFLRALIIWSEENVKNTTDQVVDTNNKQIKDSVNEARQGIIEEGEEVTDRDLAANTTAILKRKTDGRQNLIAETETQRSAENTKLIEAGIFSGLTADQILKPMIPKPVLRSYKIWNTVGDRAVRKIHADINGMRKTLDKPFIAGGESLMYPGDTSLGATMKNTANCRCSLTYRIKRVEV